MFRRCPLQKLATSSESSVSGFNELLISHEVTPLLTTPSHLICHQVSLILYSDLFLIILFIYLFLAVLFLCRCVGFSLVAESRGSSVVAACGLLIEGASVAVAPGLSSCSSQALEHRPNSGGSWA